MSEVCPENELREGSLQRNGKSRVELGTCYLCPYKVREGIFHCLISGQEGTSGVHNDVRDNDPCPKGHDALRAQGQGKDGDTKT